LGPAESPVASAGGSDHHDEEVASSTRNANGDRSVGRALRRRVVAMGLLDRLLQGGQDRDDYQDFVNRYDQGPPYEGISHDGAVGRYQQVARELSPEVYQQSARDALSRMVPRSASSSVVPTAAGRRPGG
jgi:hypothetical protein